MQIQFLTRKTEGQYEAALIVDNKFRRSASSRSVTDLMTKLLGPLLSQEQEEGTEIAVSVGILTAAEVARAESREDRARKTAESEAEAAELARLQAALDAEAAARQTEAKDGPAQTAE